MKIQPACSRRTLLFAFGIVLVAPRGWCRESGAGVAAPLQQQHPSLPPAADSHALSDSGNYQLLRQRYLQQADSVG